MIVHKVSQSADPNHFRGTAGSSMVLFTLGRTPVTTAAHPSGRRQDTASFMKTVPSVYTFLIPHTTNLPHNTK